MKKILIFMSMLFVLSACAEDESGIRSDVEYEKLNPLVEDLLASPTQEAQESRLLRFFDGYEKLKETHPELFPLSMLYFNKSGSLLKPLELSPESIHYAVFIDEYANMRREKSLAFTPFILVPKGDNVRLLLVVE